VLKRSFSSQAEPDKNCVETRFDTAKAELLHSGYITELTNQKHKCPEIFTRFTRYPAVNDWAIDILDPYNSIVYKNLPLKGTFCSFSLRERAGVRGKRYFG
jgi:hypothetical protein